jgi:hypothetical protein
MDICLAESMTLNSHKAKVMPGFERRPLAAKALVRWTFSLKLVDWTQTNFLLQHQ